LVQWVNHENINEIKAERIIPADGTIEINSGVQPIKLLVFREVPETLREYMRYHKKMSAKKLNELVQSLMTRTRLHLTQTRKWEKLAILNPVIHGPDWTSEVIYFNRDDVSVQRDQSEQMLRVSLIVGFITLAVFVSVVSPFLIPVPKVTPVDPEMYFGL
jgi:hypothetical protein